MEPVTTPRAGRRRGPLLAPLVLAAQEQATLQRWAERPSSAQALALRCRIVLACAEGTSNSQVARQLGVARSTVIKWRARFVAHRLDGLVDEPRPGAPRTISDEQVERVLVMTLETTPTDATHWSTRSLARKLGMSSRRSAGSGGRLGSSPIWSTPSSCRPIRSSSTRSATLPACT
jgi:transposase